MIVLVEIKNNNGKVMNLEEKNITNKKALVNELIKKGYKKISNYEYVLTAFEGAEKRYIFVTDKASAKLEFQGHDEETNRCVGYITVTSKNGRESEILDLIVDKLDVDWNRCIDREDDNTCFDSFTFDFEYGYMEETKKYIVKQFKQIKKEIGIK